MKISLILAILGIGIGIRIIVISSTDSLVTSSELEIKPSIESTNSQEGKVIQEDDLEYIMKQSLLEQFIETL